MLPKWLGYVAMVAIILSNLAAQAGSIKPIYGLAATFGSGLLLLFTRSVLKYSPTNAKITVSGIVLIAGALLTYAARPDWAGLIGTGWLQIFATAGGFLSTIGAGLKAGPVLELPPDNQ
jgi:hypothetical protein